MRRPPRAGRWGGAALAWATLAVLLPGCLAGASSPAATQQQRPRQPGRRALLHAFGAGGQEVLQVAQALGRDAGAAGTAKPLFAGASAVKGQDPPALLFAGGGGAAGQGQQQALGLHPQQPRPKVALAAGLPGGAGGAQQGGAAAGQGVGGAADAALGSLQQGAAGGGGGAAAGQDVLQPREGTLPVVTVHAQQAQAAAAGAGGGAAGQNPPALGGAQGALDAGQHAAGAAAGKADSVQAALEEQAAKLGQATAKVAEHVILQQAAWAGQAGQQGQALQVQHAQHAQQGQQGQGQNPPGTVDTRDPATIVHEQVAAAAAEEQRKAAAGGAAAGGATGAAAAGASGGGAAAGGTAGKVGQVQAALEEQAKRLGQDAKDAAHVVQQQAVVQQRQAAAEAAGAAVQRAAQQQPQHTDGADAVAGSGAGGGDAGAAGGATGAAGVGASKDAAPVPQPLNAEVTTRLWRDSAPAGLVDAPEPKLTSEDGLTDDGRKVQIYHWADAQSTLPRDLLGPHRPEARAGAGWGAVWLYSALAVDYDGYTLLPHFLEHYARLGGSGIRPERMLLVVHHKANAPGLAPHTLESVLAVLGAWGVDYRVWYGAFSADAHLRVKLEGATWVQGRLIDRVSNTGRLAGLAAAPSLFLQYPLACNVTGEVAHAEVTKVAAFKGFLRSGVGNHGIVPPIWAEHYFGPTEVGKESPRYGLCGGEDLFPLTPYARYWRFYSSPVVLGNPYLWETRQADATVPIHHFKWHSGVERSVPDRLAHYRGDDLEAPCGPAGTPRFKFWHESERLNDEVVAKGGIQVRGRKLGCKKAANPRRPMVPQWALGARLEMRKVLLELEQKQIGVVGGAWH
eukprot:scaffold8.g1392.t1